MVKLSHMKMIFNLSNISPLFLLNIRKCKRMMLCFMDTVAACISFCSKSGNREEKWCSPETFSSPLRECFWSFVSFLICWSFIFLAMLLWMSGIPLFAVFKWPSIFNVFSVFSEKLSSLMVFNSSVCVLLFCICSYNSAL